jgi:outer membrane protein OmpA-like peptidoglycan-associated protein
MGRAELPGIKFVTGGDALDPASEPSLRSLATVLTESPGVFLIQGRADPGAAPADAAQVANARAAAIKAWLVGNGIPAERVFAAGEAAAVPGAPLVTVTRMQ